MKTSVFLLFVMFTGLACENAIAQNAPEKQHKADSVATYEAFIAQSKAKIKQNEESIDALKAKRDKRLADIKVKYDTQITALESKNKAIRKKVKQVRPGNWKSMQDSLNSDMEAFENFLLLHAADNE